MRKLRLHPSDQELDMTQFASTIDIDRPVRDVYDAWTQFEDFPQFMEHVDEVRQIDDTHLHWCASIAGQTHEWDAKIIDQQPDQLISWQATDAPDNSGSVSFESIDATRTRVTLDLHYEPQGVLEKVGTALGAMKLNVKRDLESFRTRMEEREDDGGAWRGEVTGGIEASGDSSAPII
jgi:uncharacterized membrane protein